MNFVVVLGKKDDRIYNSAFQCEYILKFLGKVTNLTFPFLLYCRVQISKD